MNPIVNPALHSPRRLRRQAAMRALVREHQLSPSDFILPLFVVAGESVRNEVPSMPGVYQTSVDQTVATAREAAGLGIPAVILFGVPESCEKDVIGSEAWNPEGLVQQVIRAIKAELPQMLVMTDACFCEYTEHGHCGVLDHRHDRDEAATLGNLQRLAISYAEAGADVVAPSGMVDGMVAAMREALDASAHPGVAVMSYAIKYASAYYGPFRDAADSAPQFGDRKAYQMDPANRREALRELALDLAEGADIVMVKPALAYMDLIRDVRNSCDTPVAAYNVSGEYSMVKAAAMNGWIDERAVVLETLLGFKRAGADMILTYHALDAARWLG
ncbi:MAG: porphobilinogen synthase [Pseudomonadota bacterium]|uniref:porphobilinogen synthase n=1 Tax=Thermithiobacillus tepidarius TaxID=929 RepID=UPI000422A916|nr:porphobilinogen synthase [Thermithiobacillus tepidarius]